MVFDVFFSSLLLSLAYYAAIYSQAGTRTADLGSGRHGTAFQQRSSLPDGEIRPWAMLSRPDKLCGWAGRWEG